MKAFDVSETKSFSPYEWFDSTTKLDYTSLPPYADFYSHLRKHNTFNAEYESWNGEGPPPKAGPENYQLLQQVWVETGMQKMVDFLEYYNNKY